MNDDGLRTCRGLLIALLIILPIWFICGLVALVAMADEPCPDPQLRYDIQAGECMWGWCECPGSGENVFAVKVMGTGSITWTVCPGRSVTCVRIIDEEIHWLPWVQEGSWEGGEYADFWGSAQVPGPMPEECQIPARAYLPLVRSGPVDLWE